MGISPFPFPFDPNGIQGKEELPGQSNSNVSLRSKVLEAQSTKIRMLKVKQQQQRLVTKKKARRVRGSSRRRPRSILMKRAGRPVGSRRRTINPIQKKVRTLKKLIPNNESNGLDGLFKDTAEYILSLQMRVKVMQILVQILTGSKDE